MRRILTLAALAASLTGCASITEGTDQRLTVAAPVDAVCRITRKGDTLAQGFPGGASVIVSKSRNPITVTCQTATLAGSVTVESEVTRAGVAGALMLDGGLTDYMTGALNAYPDIISVALRGK